MTALVLILYYNKTFDECVLLVKRKDAIYSCFVLCNNGDLTQEQLEEIRQMFHKPPIPAHVLNKQLH